VLPLCPNQQTLSQGTRLTERCATSRHQRIVGGDRVLPSSVLALEGKGLGRYFRYRGPFSRSPSFPPETAILKKLSGLLA
jgi:hypothetical protein